MKITIKKPIEYDAKFLQVEAEVRYWEDAEIKRMLRSEGVSFPSREGDSWRPLIEIDTGNILNWKQGETAEIHFKVCDAGIYTLLDANKREIIKKDGYVPNMMSPKEEGYGDYIIMDIDENGHIENWKPSFGYFIDEDEY